MSSFLNTDKRGVIVRVLFVVSLIAVIVTIVMGGKSNTIEETTTTTVTKIDPEKQYTIEYDPALYNLSISSDIIIDNITYTGQANIMNIRNDNESMVVDITLDETDELIYQSQHIYTEEVVENIKITKELEPGTYPATATFNVHDKDTKELLTQIVLMINITIVKSL